MLRCGITYPTLKERSRKIKVDLMTNDILGRLETGFWVEDPIVSNCMPESWVRSAIFIRINSLVRGASGVRPVILERMADLLNQRITPQVPIHGSISASGDLSPSSYIAGCIQGNPNTSVIFGEDRRLATADIAMAAANISPLRLEAKEGIAIVNGTAFSAGLGSLVAHDVIGLCALSQVLVAMSVEALHGAVESFDPFFSDVRPHPGQVIPMILISKALTDDSS